MWFRRLATGCAVFGSVALWAESSAVNDWENPAVNSINRLPARTFSLPLENARAAFTDAVEFKTPYAQSLNGEWKFSWAGAPELRAKDFWKVDFDDSRWNTIDVPSCVELRGWGSPGYTNIRYPHANAWPKILDRDTNAADYNPVSSYRTRFTIPESWRGRRTILRFDGVYSAYYVWLNGRRVGYAEDSKLPSEFDVSEFLREGENLLCVEVYRWCDGSYLEDQDMFRYSGIFRDVTLWSMPQDGIWDFIVRAGLENDYRDGRLQVSCPGATAMLYDDTMTKVGECQADGRASILVKNVSAWSAEKPNLYTLVLKKGDDLRARRVGFKDQRIDGHVFKVNGRPVKFKGVNRHETSPENGRAIGIDEMLRDVTLFKRYNINTVRTSHYPDHRLWYDLCDLYGIYVVAEANVEGHEPGYGENGLGRIKAWEPSIVERNERHVRFYRNHPSVTMWSLGNETGHGVCFSNAATRVRAADPTRPVHWERGCDVADVDSCMYPLPSWLEERGVSGDLPSEAGKGISYWGMQMSQGKCFFLCEYAHAMGNALGNFQEYWDAFYAHDSLSGGCIWDWIDQAVWKYTDRIDPATGRRERFLAYGGDFDESPNDGPFCVNGVIGPTREVTPKLIEVAHVHRNLVTTLNDKGAYEIQNRFLFTDASEFEGRWEHLVDGRVRTNGTFVVPKTEPLGIGRFRLREIAPDASGENLVNVSYCLRQATRWAPKGWVVANDQIRLLPPTVAVPAPAKAGDVFVEDEGETVRVDAGRTTAIFSKASGTLQSLTMRGVHVLADMPAGIVTGPQLTCMRAFTDNDHWLRSGTTWGNETGNGFYDSGLTRLSYHPAPIEAMADGVRTTVRVTGAKSAGFDHVAEWHFASDGTISVSNRVTSFGTMPRALPRLGLSLKLAPRLSVMEYYGRGPWENYIDRQTGSFLGIWKSTVAEQFVDYVRPQDNGYKSDVRWVAFAGKDGAGVRFWASEPMFVQALHYGWEDLEFARHRAGQQRFRAPLQPRAEVCLNLDVRQLGLGGASCGPATLKKYRFDPAAPVEWTLFIESCRKVAQ